jgi:uncharacterized membrane protein
MESRAKFLGHALHQQLIPFPLGLLVTSVIFDVIHLVTGGEQWALVAFWMIAAGVIGGLVAAIFGAIDFMAIPSGTRAKRIGALHGGGNVVMVALFAASWLLRTGSPTDPSTLAFVLSLAGGGLSGLTGWLGGELVDRMGVGVDEGAHLNAPSSLSGRPASEGVRPPPRVAR